MRHNKNLTQLAQKLRREMTKEERKLWYDFLREYPVQFRRQVTCGRYILDFYCSKAKLAIELDGSQHFDPEKMARDMERAKFFEDQGIYILRIPNNEIWKNLAGVCDQIHMDVERRLSVCTDLP